MIDHLEPHYPIAECAEYLECSPEWLRGKLRARVFSGVKIAGRWRMRESQLEAAMDTMSTGARPQPAPSPAGLPRTSRMRKRIHNTRQAS